MISRTRACFSISAVRESEKKPGLFVRRPVKGLEGEPRSANTAVVELVLPEEQLFDAREEEPRLRALDDAMVVGRGERKDLADRQRDRTSGASAENSAGYAIRARRDDQALARHEAGHRGRGSERPGLVREIVVLRQSKT